MGDDRGGSEGSANKASEDARRYYQEQHGGTASQTPGETRLQTGGSPRNAGDKIVQDDPDGAAQIPSSEADGRRPEAARSESEPRDESSLALGESKDQGSKGPHILDRSFSGTYKD